MAASIKSVVKDAKVAGEALKTKATRAAKAAAQAVQPEVESPKTAFEEMQEAISAARARFLASSEAPSWKRTTCAFVLALLAYCGSYYYGIQLANVLLAGLMMLVGNGFIAFLAAVLAIVIVLVGATVVGTAVFSVVQHTDFGAIKNRVTGWFKRDHALA